MTCKVLIVEDEGIVAQDLMEALTRLGYRISGVASEGTQAVAMARAGRSGSTPRSKRMLASVLRPSALLVRRTDRAANVALSNTMVVVADETSESAPPITPATAAGQSTRLTLVSAMLCPSSSRHCDQAREASLP